MDSKKLKDIVDAFNKTKMSTISVIDTLNVEGHEDHYNDLMKPILTFERTVAEMQGAKSIVTVADFVIASMIEFMELTVKFREIGGALAADVAIRDKLDLCIDGLVTVIRTVRSMSENGRLRLQNHVKTHVNTMGLRRKLLDLPDDSEDWKDYYKFIDDNRTHFLFLFDHISGVEKERVDPNVDTSLEIETKEDN